MGGLWAADALSISQIFDPERAPLVLPVTVLRHRLCPTQRPAFLGTATSAPASVTARETGRGRHRLEVSAHHLRREAEVKEGAERRGATAELRVSTGERCRGRVWGNILGSLWGLGRGGRAMEVRRGGASVGEWTESRVPCAEYEVRWCGTGGIHGGQRHNIGKRTFLSIPSGKLFRSSLCSIPVRYQYLSNASVD